MGADPSVVGSEIVAANYQLLASSQEVSATFAETFQATGTLRSGMGAAANSRWQGLASHRAHWDERETRALSVAIPVSAYIWR